MIRHTRIYALFTMAFLAFATLIITRNSSALTYSQDVPVSFTFNSSITLTVSADLTIANLSPGTTATSNVITVTAMSNEAAGYTINASVGDNTHTAPSYNNTSLNHISNNGSVFSSVATNASLANLTADNTWGYSISLNNGTTWSNYSGLPIYSSSSWKELVSANNGTTELKFKIAAKASSSQVAGEYRNVINFAATARAVSP